MPELSKILYVEDDPDIATVTQMTLEALGGFEVLHCFSGAKALQELEPMAPDLVLLDVMMPEMDGMATYDEIRKLPKGKAVPIIFMTARVQSHEVQEYLDLGAIGVISKPFEPTTLCGQIRTIWQEKAA